MVAPGTYTIRVAATDKDKATGTTEFTIVVKQEDARATYTGDFFASTSSISSSTATVTLAATIRDITAVTGDPAYDAYAGDIRNANVKFVNRDASNAVLCTASVGLVNPGDTKTGTAICNWPATISGDSQQFTVGIIVNNYYIRDSSAENTVVTVSKPIGTNFITGGGYLVLINSNGQYAGDVGSKNNFGFNVKYNKAGTNLQGNLNTIFRRTESNGLHVYQIKSASWGTATLTTKICSSTTASATCPSTASFTAKANLVDITNPLSPVTKVSGAPLQVSLTDKGEPGTADTISITLSGTNGGVLYSSSWTGTKTVEQVIGGGNLVVH
jgi:hypothetical protein